MLDAAIIGVGQTSYEAEKKGYNFAEMVYEATDQALNDAGLTMDDIDNVVSVSNDFFDGRTISCMAVMDASGASHNDGKNVSTVEGDGTFGAFYGLMRILAGVYKTTLVVVHSKGSESNPSLIYNSMFDYIYTKSTGLDHISSSALQARRYMNRYGLGEEDFARVAVKNLGNAQKNSRAHRKGSYTVSDVMGSTMLADPIKELDAALASDGAAAIVLGHKVVAEKLGKKPVWVKGAAHCCDAYNLGDRDLSDVNALADAAQRAYAMAGIEDPFNEIDVVELYEQFSFQELLYLEAMGFCRRGEAASLLQEGVTALSGALPVNPSGGCLGAHPVLVAGMARLIEAVLQVRGEAGSYQVPGAKNALAHGVNGPCGQSHCVLVVGE